MTALLRKRSRGYTVVEILSAMTLFAVGAAGVISMQRVTIKGGDDARRMDVATGIANEMAARIQRDSAYWNSAANLPDTYYIKNAISGDTAWLDPPSTAADYIGHGGSFDMFGRERPPGSGDHVFCAQYQLSWIQAPVTNAPGGEILRVQIRVFWARLDNAPVANCNALTVAPPLYSATATPTSTYYHFVYLTTAVRMNAPSQ